LDSYVYFAAKKSLKLRYSLLKYYYSLFVKNNGVGSVFRPLIFEFPNDELILNLEVYTLEEC